MFPNETILASVSRPFSELLVILCNELFAFTYIFVAAGEPLVAPKAEPNVEDIEVAAASSESATTAPPAPTPSQEASSPPRKTTSKNDAPAPNNVSVSSVRIKQEQIDGDGPIHIATPPESPTSSNRYPN